MNRARAAIAQTATSVVHHRLRDRAEHKSSYHLKREKHWDQKRHDPQTHEPRYRPPARHAREGLISRRNQPPGEGDTLRLIGIQESAARTPVQDSGEFPCEVH